MAFDWTRNQTMVRDMTHVAFGISSDSRALSCFELVLIWTCL